jgi:probable rRNA maturation factor
MMQLHIFKEHNVRVPRKMIQFLFESIYQKELPKKSCGSVNLIFSHDKRLRELNKQFRDKNLATDVLSFNIDEPTDEKALFGEIYISVQTAQKQANDYNASLSEEIIRLCCHGFLHLLGYDHIDPQDAVVMKSKEDIYLTKVYS